MTSKGFVHSFFSTYVWGNVLAIVILVTMLSIGVRYGIDYYTHMGESIVVPNILHKQYDDALDIMDKVGLTIEVADTGYVKDLPPDCILEQTPAGGKRIKSTRVIYVTINAASAPTLPLPDIADNSSLREAQAELLSMGFKVGDPEYIPGEKDWVYGPGSRYEEIEVEEPKYEEYYDWVEVPVDENGNEIKEGGKSDPRTLPSVPPQSQALPPGQNTPKPTE